MSAAAESVGLDTNKYKNNNKNFTNILIVNSWLILKKQKILQLYD